MKIKFPKNTNTLTSSLNQFDENETKYACTFFGPAINLRYNCGISLTEKDLKNIAHEQFLKGKFNYENGGYLKDGIAAVFQYIKTHAIERGWEIPTLYKFQKSEKIFDNIMKNGYSIIVGIGVTKEFYSDLMDGKIDLYEDYINYKGLYYKHCTNLVKKFDLNSSGKMDSDYILDNYGDKNINWFIECDIQELRDDIIGNNCYTFV